MSSRRSVGLVVAVVLGVVLMWWGTSQIDEAQRVFGSTFQWPMWRALGYLLTFVASGAAFGLAAAFARQGSSDANVPATLIVAAVPFAILVYYWAYPLGWFSAIGGRFGLWLLQGSTVVACCLIVGFVVANLVRIESAR